MKRANTMSTITVELTIKVKTKFIPSNAEKTNGFISPQMSNFHIKLLRSMSNKVRSSHDSFLHFCDDSAGKAKAKHMENGLIFHVTIQIQILTMFSVQSKYSKKTKSISLSHFWDRLAVPK